jgi:plasmid stabilization system protein ParE
MKLELVRAEEFVADFRRQLFWYVADSGREELGWRFEEAVEHTLQKLREQPTLGRKRTFRDPRLEGLRSFPVRAPFGRVLLFYRANEKRLEAWRLMHGARDLARRLLNVEE